MTPHANLLKNCVYKETYTFKENHNNKEILTARKKGIFSSFSLSFPVPLVAYVVSCLRKQGAMAFCEKSWAGMDTSSFPQCVRKTCYVLGNREF